MTVQLTILCLYSRAHNGNWTTCTIKSYFHEFFAKVVSPFRHRNSVLQFAGGIRQHPEHILRTSYLGALGTTRYHLRPSIRKLIGFFSRKCVGVRLPYFKFAVSHRGCGGCKSQVSGNFSSLATHHVRYQSGSSIFRVACGAPEATGGPHQHSQVLFRQKSEWKNPKVNLDWRHVGESWIWRPWKWQKRRFGSSWRFGKRRKD